MLLNLWNIKNIDDDDDIFILISLKIKIKLCDTFVWYISWENLAKF